MPWKKVTPGEGRGHTKREPRTEFAVRRNRAGNGSAAFVIPGAYINGATRCDVYRDGAKLAFALGSRGDYKLSAHGPKSKARSVSIPATIGKTLPYGTRDVSVTFDGDMIVVDLAQITPVTLAAE